MANTVSNISYANTFGDWVVATDALIRENNTLAKGNYTKDSGTLTLSESSAVALTSSGDIVAQKQLLVQGVASSATIDNNLTVGKQVYFTNTVLGLTHSGQANMNGLIVAQGPNIGIFVANNAHVNGNTTIRYNTVTDKVQANTSVTTPLVSSDTITNSGTVYTNQVRANSLITSTTINNSGFVYSDTVVANTSVTTPTLSSTTINNSDTVRTNILTANISASVPTLSVATLIDGNTASGFLNNLYAQNMTVSGNFVQTGATIYAANTFVLSQNAASAINSYYNVDRGPGETQASFRWTEISKNWQTRNVTSGTYYRVLTDEYLSDSVNSTSSTSVATANVANYLYNQILATKTIFTGTSGAPFTSNTLTFSSNNGVTIVPVGSNTVAISTSQDLRTTATPTFSTLTLSTTPLGTGSGGSGQTSASGAFNTFITGAAGTGSSGQVLTTGGAGSYYWAAGGGGGGSVQPGTTISSSRLTYSGDNANTVFATPVFSQTNQLRAYINGVRQFQSEYSSNSAANTITFSTPPSVGDSVLIEVDGYILNPYYANNIPVTPTGTITGNTIQDAIGTLESAKAPLAGATFTGVVSGLTYDANTSNTSFATTQFVKNVLNQPAATSGSTYAINTSGNAATVTNGVYTTGTQTIGGTKTFSSTIVGSIDGNAATVTTIPSLSGDVTSSGNALTLVNSGTNTGNFGSGTTVPIITVDSKGRITSISSTLITGGSAGTGSTTYNRVTTTGTAGQTLISSIPHTTGYLQIYLNGMMLPANDYTSNASNSSIVITSPLRAGDIVDSFAYTTTIANNLSPGTTGGSAGTVLYQSAANTTSNTSVGTSGYLLTSAGTGQPTWTNPASLSFTTANSQFNTIGVGTAADSANTGTIRATGTITAGYSDDQLKTKLGNIDNALDKLMTLNGFYYEPSQIALDLGYTLTKQVGVSAQEVQKVLPEVVVPAPIDDKYLTVQYDRMIPLLIEAIKELKEEVEVLKGQIK